MRFAVVELRPGEHDFALISGSRPGYLTGVDVGTNTPVQVPVDRVVHCGFGGTGANEPMAVFQFCPAWLRRSLAERYGAVGLSAAANPAQELKLTKAGYDGRKVQREAALERLSHKQNEFFPWGGYDPRKQYGHVAIQRFILEHRSKVTQRAVFWSMLFAAMTSAEETGRAEERVVQLANLIRPRLAAGREIGPDLLSVEDFVAVWGKAFFEQKMKQANLVLRSANRVYQHLKNQTMRDQDFRDTLVIQEGVPEGLGITKFTFALECLGFDVACVDRWMVRSLGTPAALPDWKTAPKSRSGTIGEVMRGFMSKTKEKWTEPGMRSEIRKQKANFEKEISKLPEGRRAEVESWVRSAIRSKAARKAIEAEAANLDEEEPSKTWNAYESLLKKAVREKFPDVAEKAKDALDAFLRIHLREGQLRSLEKAPYPHQLKLEPEWKPWTEESWVLSEYAKSRFDCDPRPGTRRLNPNCVREYRWWEDRLRETKYYRAALVAQVPNPIARAQWTMWEDVKGRQYSHDSLFEAIYGREAVGAERERATLSRGAVLTSRTLWKGRPAGAKP